MVSKMALMRESLVAYMADITRRNAALQLPVLRPRPVVSESGVTIATHVEVAGFFIVL